MITEYKMFPETPVCPKCNEPLRVSDVVPTMPITGVDQDEVVWKCNRCRAEVKQVFDRQRAEPVILGQ